MRRTMHCHAFGHPGAWQAYCLDLDIAVAGTSFEDVECRLKAAISSYLHAAMESDGKEREALLRRRMPFLTRLRFGLQAFLAAMRDRGDDDLQHQFTMPCSA